MSYEEKHRWMTQTPVNRLIPRLAVPTILSMLVTSIYNTADTYFVSQIDTSASAAVGVIFSVMTMIQAIGFTLGMGSGNYISRMLGKKEHEKAQQACSVSFYTGILLGILLMAFGFLNLQKLVRLLGATETVAPYAVDYCRFILLAAPYMVATFVLNNHLRSQGCAALSMIGIMTGGILNMILDPIFIFVLKWGISGAAIATVLSQLISFIILLVITLCTKNILKPNPRSFCFHWRIYWEILYAGLPTLARQGCGSLSSVVVNLVASGYGDAALAAMSIVHKIMMFIFSAFLGFGQGFQPVCGYNFGARRYDRVLQSFYFSLKVATIMLTALGGIFFILAEPVMRAFRDDPQVIEIGVRAMRFQCMTQPLQSVIIMGNMLAQSIGYGFRATLTAVGRQGLFYIPALYVFPQALGILGLELAQPIADICTFFFVAAILFFILRDLKRKERAEAVLKSEEADG